MSGELRCHNLIIVGELSNPNASRCAVYKNRTPGMAIMMLTPEGTVGAIGVCAHGTPQDDVVIIEKGIGKGCSMEIING